MPIQTQGLVIDTPSPEMKPNHFKMTTPKGACRQILNSPALMRKEFTDEVGELTMSPLQLNDSPVHTSIVPMTPSTSQSVNGSSCKSPRFLKQCSTPSDDVIPDTPSNKNKAFVIATNTSKAKRRLIDDSIPSPSSAQPKPSTSFSSPMPRGNVAKKVKVTPKIAKRTYVPPRKKRYGSINAGVGHSIRRPKPAKKVNVNEKKVPTVSELLPTVVDEENKNKASGKELHTMSSDVDRPTKDPEFPSSAEPLQETVTKLKEPPAIKNTVTKSTPNSKESVTKLERKIEIVPKVITRSWNHGYRAPQERRFFKSRAAPEQLQDRVVTVSVNDNLKLQIREKPLYKSPRKSPRKLPLKSPRKSPRKAKWTVEPIENSPAVNPVKSSEISVDLLHQDWEDAGDVMDISTNIQQILEGLSNDESSEDAPVLTTLAAAEIVEPEEKENKSVDQSAASKLFPVFYKEMAKSGTSASPSAGPRPQSNKFASGSRSQWIRARNDGESQRILDAGQKVYGAVQCPECSMVYHAKEPEDELLHVKIHESMKDTLKFLGWKKERVVRRHEPDGYIIVVHPSDPIHCWNKVHNILKNVVDNELGFADTGIRRPESTKVYMYIVDKKIMGVLVAEAITSGFRMLADSASSQGKCCSTEASPAVCGVSRIWTLASYRRHKVATRLVDAMRSEFVYGQYIGLDEVAFSDPTENGLAFAHFYTKRNDFLVYNM